MYFENKNEFDKIVKAMIIKKFYLIKNFKTNLLIENNIFDSKFIDIFTSINIIYIDNCDITILIFVKARSKFQHLSIYALHTVIISFDIEQLFRIHNVTLSNRHYFFESI